jgi:hypothetical protein
MTTIFKIAEQCLNRINKGPQGPNEDIRQQELNIAVYQAFGTVVKGSYFQNKNEGITEINGTFIYSFKNIVPALDTDLEIYTCILPSSYIDLPREIGIQYVGFMQSGNPKQPQSKPMLRVPNNFAAMSQGLAVENLQTRTPFYVEGNNLYFPKMTADEAKKNLLIKLAVSLEGIDEDTAINIPPEMQAEIIELVVAKFMPEKQLPESKEGNEL